MDKPGSGSGRASSYLPMTATPTHSPSKSKPDKSLKRQLFNLLISPISRLPSKVKAALFVITLIVNLGLSLWAVVEHGNIPELFTDPSWSREVEARKCHLPVLLPFSPEIKPYLMEPNRLDCPATANTDFKNRIFFKTDFDGNLIRISEPGIPCCWRPFYRVNDGEVWIEPTRDRRYVCHNITEPTTPIPEKIEYIEILCDDKKSRSYKDAFVFVRKKAEVEDRVKKIIENEKSINPKAVKEKLSLIVLGMDSTSQMNFERKMPRSREYLKNTLNGIKLEGYVKVGDNTLPNLVPLLTGLDEGEFRDLCVMKNPPMQQAVHLDGCPFVWKHFVENGFRTVLGEDEVSTGIFNLYWPYAFLQPPTDHYLRPFSYRMTTSQNVYDGFCMGPRMSYQVMLEYLEKSAHTYLNSPSDEGALFHFSWASKLMHDDFNRLGWGDQYLVKTLRKLNEAGHLNRSALLILSDHGSRTAEDFRKTRQGQLEDRLPLAWLVVPPWFEQKYSTAMKNLRTNSKLITSAYDLHETMMDFADLGKLNDPHTHYIRQRKLKVAEKKGYRRGTSLFTSLPEHRSCTTAGIPPHWCICYKKKKISVKSLDAHDAVNYVLRELNAQLMGYRGVCEHLRLSKIITALKWNPEEAIQDTWNGNHEESYKKSTLLQVNFLANKEQAHFEVTVIFDPDHGWKFTEQVVRLDRYADKGKCMEKQELKKLCLCLDPDIPPKRDSVDSLQSHDFPIF